MKILCRLLLIIVLFSFSGNHLKGQTLVPVQTVVETAVDSLHNQLKSELDEEYKFKAKFLNHRDKTVDWVLAFAAIIVTIISAFGVINFFQHRRALNDIYKMSEEAQVKIKDSISSSEAKVENHLSSVKNDFDKMTDRADYYLDKIIKNKEKSDKILAKNRKYQSSESNNLDTFSNIPEQKSEEYLKPYDQIESNETNDSDALNSLCKLADSYLVIDNHLDVARAIWNIIVKDFKLNKKDLAFAYYKMAEIEEKVEKVDLSQKILTLLDIAIQLDSENEYYFTARGELYFSQGEYGKAENDFDTAIKVGNGERNFYYYERKGDIKVKEGIYQKAIDYYNSSIHFNSIWYKSYMKMANAYLKLGQYPEAFKNYYQAYQPNPSDIQLFMNAYELAILLNKNSEASFLKRNCQNDESTITDYLNLLYEIVFEQKTEFNWESIKAKLSQYKPKIDWSFDVAKDILKEKNNETANKLIMEYEQLINEHNEQFKTV